MVKNTEDDDDLHGNSTPSNLLWNLMKITQYNFCVVFGIGGTGGPKKVLSVVVCWSMSSFRLGDRQCKQAESFPFEE